MEIDTPQYSFDNNRPVPTTHDPGQVPSVEKIDDLRP
jgi:hypothetical protein